MGCCSKLPKPLSEPVGGVIRLRQLADNRFLPVDADLIPALLPDEAKALVLRRGLVFLPGGRVLEFQHDKHLSLSEMVHIKIDRGKTSGSRAPELPPMGGRSRGSDARQSAARSGNAAGAGAKGSARNRRIRER